MKLRAVFRIGLRRRAGPCAELGGVRPGGVVADLVRAGDQGLIVLTGDGRSDAAIPDMSAKAMLGIAAIGLNPLRTTERLSSIHYVLRSWGRARHFGPVFVPPDDRADRMPQVLGWLSGVRTTRLHRRLKHGPLRLTQHASSFCQTTNPAARIVLGR